PRLPHLTLKTLVSGFKYFPHCLSLHHRLRFYSLEVTGSVSRFDTESTQQFSLSHESKLIPHSRQVFASKVYIKEPPCIMIDLRDSHISHNGLCSLIKVNQY